MSKILHTSDTFPTKGEATRHATRLANKGEFKLANVVTRKSLEGDAWVYDVVDPDQDDDTAGDEVAPRDLSEGVADAPAPVAKVAKGKMPRAAKVKATPAEVDAPAAEIAPPVEVVADAAPVVPAAKRGRKRAANVEASPATVDDTPPADATTTDAAPPVEVDAPASRPLSMSEVAEMQGQDAATLAAAPTPPVEVEQVAQTPAPVAAAPAGDATPPAEVEGDAPAAEDAALRPGSTELFVVRLRDATPYSQALAVAQSFAKRAGLVVELVGASGEVVRTLTGRETVARDPAAPRVQGERAPRSPRSTSDKPEGRTAAMIALAVRKGGATRADFNTLCSAKQPWTQLLKIAADRFGYTYDSTRDGPYTTYFLTKGEQAKAA